MKTIGTILKEARVNKNIELEYLAELTKIKSSFIRDIEKEKWESLPPFATVLGFVKSLSAALKIDEKLSIAVLKRDYPPKKIRVEPKPDAVNKFVWSPKLTFALGISVVLIILFGYLVVQYVRFVSEPFLEVESPIESQTVLGNSINVFGSTNSDAKITINNQPVEVSGDGKFSVSLDVVPQTREIVIIASSRSGKITEIRRKIEVRSGM